MNVTKQANLEKPVQQQRKIKYVPPSTDMIRRYSHVVSHHLYNDAVAKANFTELCQGLTEFVSVVVRIETDAKNRSKNRV